MNNKQVSDAKRLAVVLDQYADDPATVQRLAQSLHYMPDQLREDMHTLYSEGWIGLNGFRVNGKGGYQAGFIRGNTDFMGHKWQ